MNAEVNVMSVLMAKSKKILVRYFANYASKRILK